MLAGREARTSKNFKLGPGETCASCPQSGLGRKTTEQSEGCTPEKEKEKMCSCGCGGWVDVRLGIWSRVEVDCTNKEESQSVSTERRSSGILEGKKKSH
jgi:hypothetical protein